MVERARIANEVDSSLHQNRLGFLTMSNGNRRNSGARVATIKDVAIEAGVSPMTVSRVVNRKGNVKQSTIDKIQEAIAKVDYRPNVGARRLSGGRTYQLLMIFNNPNVAWTGELLIGMMHACRDIGYHMLIEGVGDFEGEAFGAPIDYDNIASLIDSSRIDGVILPPPICFDQQVLDIVREKEVPCVRISGAPARDIELRVGIDNFAGAYDLANHLISLGHENLAIIKGPEGYVASALRYEGFASSMRDHGLELPESNIRTGKYDVESGYACARELLRLQRRPTAIFASNDEMAAGALSAAQELEIRVPDQLSVAGFDDAPIAHSVWPKLTTIRQPLRAMGEKSVELLEDYIRHLDSGTVDEFRPNLLLDYELRVRDSTAQCPSATNRE
jgi:LacI family transcriptional regulator